MDNKEVMRIGSGKVYCMVFAGTIPTDAVLETAENKLADISGGATLEYKVESYTGQDDLGVVKKTVLTKEDATMKLGICTFNGNTLAKLSSTARVTEDATKNIRTTKIGGIGNDDGKKYIFRFVNDDKKDGRSDITVVGKNTAGFSLAYAKDKETVINPEVTAEPNDDEGTLIIYREFAPTVASQTSLNNTVTSGTK